MPGTNDGKVVCLELDHLMNTYSWNYANKQHFSSKNTYIIIFGHTQNYRKEWFMKNFKGRILHEAPAALCHLHPEREKPSNTLVVFEMVDGVAPLDSQETKVEHALSL